jgi:hypothetical protein
VKESAILRKSSGNKAVLAVTIQSEQEITEKTEIWGAEQMPFADERNHSLFGDQADLAKG